MQVYRRWRKWIAGLWPFLLYGGLTLVMTWPLAAQLSTHLAGASSDSYINPWANWWTLKALREGLDFYHTDYIFYPQQVSLVFHSFSHVNTLLWLPLRPLGDLAAYNLTVLLAYALSGWAMYFLVKRLTQSVAAAWVAGLIFAFSPHHLAEGDHPVIISTQWIPLFAWYFMHALHTGERRSAWLAAAFFILNALTSWHLMIFASMWGALYVFHVLFSERRLAWQALCWFALVAALALGPLLYPLIHEQAAEPFMAVEMAQGGKGNDLIAFFTPAMRHPLWSRYLTPLYDRLGYTSGSLKRPTGYVGYTTLALAAAALAFGRRRVSFWLLSALLFALLSLNSHLSVTGIVYKDIPMPWSEPLVGLLRHPHRFNLLLSFSIAVLAGWGWTTLQERWAGPKRAALVLLVSALILGESLARPWPTTPVRVSPFYQQLAAEPGDFAIAVLPMGRARAKESMYYQTLHGKKLVEGAISRTPRQAYNFIEGNPLLAQMRRDEPPALPAEELAAQLAGLREHNVRYLVLHKARLTPQQIADWRALLGRPPVYEDDILLAFGGW